MIVLNDGKGARLIANEMPGYVLLTHNVQVNIKWFTEAAMGKDVEELESLGLSVDSAFLSCAFYLTPSAILQPSFWKFVWFATAEWPSELSEEEMESEATEVPAVYPLQAFLDIPFFVRLAKRKRKPVAAMLAFEDGVLVNMVTDQGLKGVDFYEDASFPEAEAVIKAQGIDAHFEVAALKRPFVANPYTTFEDVLSEEENSRKLFWVSAGVLALGAFFWAQAGFFYVQGEALAGKRLAIARQVAALEAKKKEEEHNLEKWRYVQALMEHEKLMKALKKLPSCPFREAQDRLEFPFWCKEPLEGKGFRPKADLRKGVLFISKAKAVEG